MNQVIVFAVSDNLFIRGWIFNVTGNGNFYYKNNGPKSVLELTLP